ncbi:hypothetical protein ARC20_03255 [Stenotrophomonas panacihumi]|uniref:Uncharacterized protein n=1 Tax=Stenotrophomonas panacihumi TaxID=676599 RepID=A0A0R0AQ40_9GAMM|nr:hypothetical protein [Stenotrophomonas panacihumi]KRG47360.1 hypothetical protein ARC20_03255 [Stenotrophomonas panacihumi]PTN55838.1 hypothetical protein C9J98_04495 [Stenotrophomonas panacihumi]
MSTALQLQPDEIFEARLRLWAYWFGERGQRASEEAAMLEEEQASGAGLYRSPGASATAVAEDVDPVANIIRRVANRDRGGDPRRRLHGQAAGLSDRKGNVAPVPSWAVDPVRCAETRGAAGARTYVPTDAERVERAVLDLQARHAANGLALRLHYCTFGHPLEKAETMGIGRGKFRELVAEGRGWVRCRLGA